MDGSLSRFASPLSSMQQGTPNGLLAQIRSPIQAAPAAPLQIANAVTSKSDTANINPMAQSMAELQALIERLNAATAPDAMSEALRAIKDYVKDGTNADFLGGAMEQLSKMADTVLAAIAKDPASVAGGFAFAMQGSFAQATTSSDDYYSNKTSFNFSFSYADARTSMAGNFSFDESLEMTGNGFKYQSSERATISLTTTNVNLDTNPVLQAFLGITNSMTSDLFDLNQTGLEEAMLQAGSYRQASVIELMQAQFASLDKARDNTESLIDMLEKLMQPEAEAA